MKIKVRWWNKLSERKAIAYVKYLGFLVKSWLTLLYFNKQLFKTRIMTCQSASVKQSQSCIISKSKMMPTRWDCLDDLKAVKCSSGLWQFLHLKSNVYMKSWSEHLWHCVLPLAENPSYIWSCAFSSWFTVQRRAQGECVLRAAFPLDTANSKYCKQHEDRCPFGNISRHITFC